MRKHFEVKTTADTGNVYQGRCFFLVLLVIFPPNKKDRDANFLAKSRNFIYIYIYAPVLDPRLLNLHLENRPAPTGRYVGTHGAFHSTPRRRGSWKRCKTVGFLAQQKRTTTHRSCLLAWPSDSLEMPWFLNGKKGEGFIFFSGAIFFGGRGYLKKIFCNSQQKELYPWFGNGAESTDSSTRLFESKQTAHVLGCDDKKVDWHGRFLSFFESQLAYLLWNQHNMKDGLCQSRSFAGIWYTLTWHHTKVYLFHMCQGLNSHYCHITGGGHQPNSKGLCIHYKDSVSKVGWPSPI